VLSGWADVVATLDHITHEICQPAVGQPRCAQKPLEAGAMSTPVSLGKNAFGLFDDDPPVEVSL
jgi:hypothetical protein